MTWHDKVLIEELPTGGKDYEERRLFSPKGEMAQILNRQDDAFRHLIYWDLNSPQSNQERGHHYHARKTELYYVISGELVLSAVDISTGERRSFPLKAGNRIRVSSNIAHAFRSLGYAQILEFAPVPYDALDSFPYNLSGKSS